MHDAASALADGAWRLRGCVVMCGAHPDRVQQAQRSPGVEPCEDAITRSKSLKACEEMLRTREMAPNGPVR